MPTIRRKDNKRSLRTAAILAIAVLAGCARGNTARQPSPAATFESVSATSQIDATHRLSISVHVFAGQSQPGLTPLEIAVKDDREIAVDDAIVYAATSSQTGATPAMTFVATNDRGTYRLELPLVYGSHWSFVVKAFSGGRSGLLHVEEELN